MGWNLCNCFQIWNFSKNKNCLDFELSYLRIASTHRKCKAKHHQKSSQTLTMLAKLLRKSRKWSVSFWTINSFQFLESIKFIWKMAYKTMENNTRNKTIKRAIFIVRLSNGLVLKWSENRTDYKACLWPQMHSIQMAGQVTWIYH